MMKIGLDTIPLIYSRGADYRTAYRLYQALLHDVDADFSMLSVSRDKISPCVAMFADYPSVSIHHWRSPFRVFEWGWNHLSWPTVEWMMGDVDIYHASSIYAPPAEDAKVMITVRGIVAEVIPDKLPLSRVKALHQVLRQGIDSADYFSAVSQSTANDLERVMGIDPQRIFVVPHGVDPVFHPPEDRAALQAMMGDRFKLTNPYILFVGAMGIHKNILGLFDAWLKLSQHSDVAIDLCLVGRPDSAWELLQSRIAKEGVGDSVHHLGWIEPHSQDLVDLYGAAECFVLPSFYEGWCSPPVEAMACGTPVVVANVPSLVETTDGAAYLVDPDSIESMYEGLVAMVFDENRKSAYVEKGLKHAAAMHWQRSAMRAQAAYQSIQREAY